MREKRISLSFSKVLAFFKKWSFKKMVEERTPILKSEDLSDVSVSFRRFHFFDRIDSSRVKTTDITDITVSYSEIGRLRSDRVHLRSLQRNS